MTALEALGQSGGISAPDVKAPGPPADPALCADFDLWMEAAAAWLGLEAEPVEIPYRRFRRFVQTIGPILISLPDGSFAALDARGRVVGPDLRPRKIAADRLQSEIFRDEQSRARDHADAVLSACGVAGRRLPRARERIVREVLEPTSKRASGWQLLQRPGGRIRPQLRRSGLVSRLIALAVAHALEYVVWIAAWAMVGQGALRGRLDRGWLLGWALLLLTLVPLRSIVTWLQGQIAIRAGGWLKEYMLAGALHLEPDHARRLGAGQLLGRVVEAEAMESLALGGGFLALIAAVELAAAGVIAVFARSTPLVVLLAAWAALAILILVTYARRCAIWSRTRLAMTDELVERMVGHRTRLAQEPKDRWHEGEDQSLETYVAVSTRLDTLAPYLTALLPRGWLVAGLAAIGPAFVMGAMPPERVAISLGAILLGVRAFRKIGSGAPQLLQAFVAWRQLRPLFQAARAQEAPGSPALACHTTRPRAGDVVLEARDLIFRYGDRPQPVLRGCSFRVRAGERVVLDGPSGGGKSTLASIIAGVQKPTGGLVLAGGLDRVSLGALGWRRRVGAAPQFHENHMITGPLAFNLLMSRRGAIGDGDIAEAQSLCEELGLGDLLNTMPSGIMQIVGESGWQLSHGEQSRVFIARALLQNSDLVVLDESFAALDTANLRRAVACVEKRATAVLAIAHP
jgi:ATP-binding cassette subfamily B protein